jgi:hypothetical protein
MLALSSESRTFPFGILAWLALLAVSGSCKKPKNIFAPQLVFLKDVLLTCSQQGLPDGRGES